MFEFLKLRGLFLAFLILIGFSNCSGSEPGRKQNVDSNGYSYESYENDPLGIRVYSLANGLKVYLGQNFDEPRIASALVVKAGSAYDPADNTGLAHYLEHLLFNGNDRIGALDWETEKGILDQVTQLYEEYGATTDKAERAAIYQRIDSLSYLASQFSLLSEYPDLLRSMGVPISNGITNLDQTVYYNLVPSNSLERYLTIEAERFSSFAPRAFHSTLETVYEEYNSIQGQTWKKKYYAMNTELFRTHPYKVPGIGWPEHLKNPSILAIREYFDRHYVPDNMALMLCGDLDYDETIKLVNKTFGQLEKKGDYVQPKFDREAVVDGVRKVELWDPSEPSLFIGFRYDGAHSEDEKYVTLVSKLLSNGQAGLFDTELVSKQKVKYANSSIEKMRDYGVQYFDASPIQGQSLEELEALLVAQIEKIKKGEFEDWLLQAVVNDLKMEDNHEFNSPWVIAGPMYKSFVEGKSWGDRVNYTKELEKISKNDIVDFANRFYGENYVVVYKRTGEPRDIYNVEKPKITALANPGGNSEYGKQIAGIPIKKTEPVFPDFQEDIAFSSIRSGIEFGSVKNKTGNDFQLHLVFYQGSRHSKELPLAVDLWPLLGTDQYSVEDLRKEYYKLGITVTASADRRGTTITIGGLEENLAEAIKLVNHFFEGMRIGEDNFSTFIEAEIKKRNDRKKKKQDLKIGLRSYALYGKDSPLRDKFTEEQLLDLKADNLVSVIKALRSYEHSAFYYGKNPEAALDLLRKEYVTPGNLRPAPVPFQYAKVESTPVIYFTDYDLIQSEVYLISRGPKFNRNNLPYSNLLYFYMGNAINMEVREKRSLAYSTYAYYADAATPSEYDYFQLYASTQADKTEEVMEVMAQSVEKLPGDRARFAVVKEDLKKRYETSRVIKSGLFWSYRSNKMKGFENDISQEKYNKVLSLEIDDLERFYQEAVKNNGYRFAILGSKERVDLEALSRFGKVVELTPEELFGY